MLHGGWPTGKQEWTATFLHRTGPRQEKQSGRCLPRLGGAGCGSPGGGGDEQEEQLFDGGDEEEQLFDGGDGEEKGSEDDGREEQGCEVCSDDEEQGFEVCSDGEEQAFEVCSDGEEQGEFPGAPEQGGSDGEEQAFEVCGDGEENEVFGGEEGAFGVWSHAQQAFGRSAKAKEAAKDERSRPY